MAFALTSFGALCSFAAAFQISRELLLEGLGQGTAVDNHLQQTADSFVGFEWMS
jgi:hypothetical protein